MGRVRVNLLLESDAELSAPRLLALLHFLNIKLNKAMIIGQIRDYLISEFSKLGIRSNINYHWLYLRLYEVKRLLELRV